MALITYEVRLFINYIVITFLKPKKNKILIIT